MKGVYVLFISVSRNICVKVGALGFLKFEKGLYAYAGSAQNNLEKRLLRHQSRQKKMFWHADYLLASPYVRVLGAFSRDAPKSEECRFAEELRGHGLSVPGFGSSDCQCESHLFKILDYEFLRKQMNETLLGSV